MDRAVPDRATLREFYRGLGLTPSEKELDQLEVDVREIYERFDLIDRVLDTEDPSPFANLPHSPVAT